MLFKPGLYKEKQFADFEEMATFGPPGWGMQHFQISKGTANALYSSIETENLRVNVGHWNLGVLMRGAAPKGKVAIALPDCGVALPHFQGRAIERRSMPMLKGDTAFEFVAPDSCEMFMLTINSDALVRYTHAIWGTDPPSSRAGYRLDLKDSVQPLQLKQWFSDFFTAIRGRAATLREPKVAALVDDVLLSKILMATESRPAKLLPAHRHNCARHAAEYLRSQRDEPVTMEQLCKVVGVSWRALEHGFRDVYGLTPKAYARMVRLHHARRALRLADPAATTVTEIATRWGFFHFGRFSVEYRIQFGETPSDSLWKRNC